MTGGVRRSAWLLAVLVAVAAHTHGASRAPADDALQVRIDQALERAAAWLESRQADDGGWHSAVYGQMRGGAGNTAHVAAALASLPPAIRIERRVCLDHALDFLLRNRPSDGFVQAPDGSADYPNYATALTLTALARRGGDHAQRIPELRDYLIAAQQTERLPWEPDDGNLGSWSLVGGALDDPSSRRDGNLSTTRLAVEALAATGGVPESTARLAAAYATRLQNPDGGFRFAWDVGDPLNKAGILRKAPSRAESDVARSYGTTTADGMRALAACGLQNSDPRVRSAIDWLDSHGELDHVPGWPEDVDAAAAPSAREGLRYYYYATLSAAMNHSPDARFADARATLVELLLRLQHSDGSWINEARLQREDDPFIATAWAIEALSRLRPLVAEQ